MPMEDECRQELCIFMFLALCVFQIAATNVAAYVHKSSPTNKKWANMQHSLRFFYKFVYQFCELMILPFNEAVACAAKAPAH